MSRLAGWKRLHYMSRSKFGQTHGRSRQLLSEFHAKIPDPLIQDLPEFLAISGVRTPTIWVLFPIFISKDRLEGSAVQIEIKHISRGEGMRRQSREKPYIHRPRAKDSNRR